MEVTRLIYPKDEVIYMFAVSSLKKDCLQTIFWFCELYYSGFQYDALYAIYFTYFNFYSLQQPQLIDYIYNHIDSWSKDDNIEHFMFIIFKFQLCKYNFDTFYLFHQNSNVITKSFSFCKGRIPKRFSHLSKIQYNIVKSIEGKNINNVLYFIQNHYDTTKETFYNNFHFHSYAPKAAQYLELLSNIILSFGNNPVNEHELLKNDVDITFENQPYMEILNMDFTNCKSYKILKNYSLYGIDPIIGIFDLQRNNIEDLRDLYMYKWETFFHKSPFWKENVEKYEGSFDDNNMPCFKNTDHEEDFNNTYYLEFDEQPLDVQNKYLININSISFDDFSNYFI